MSGHRKWADIKAEQMARMTPEERQACEERQAAIRADMDAEQAAYDRALANLRRARSFTQVQLARALGVSQAQISRIENQTDLYLSTLASYVAALGGELELRAVFDDEQEFPIELGDLTAAEDAVPASNA